MKVLTTEEASRNLSELVQSAIAGEKITIYDGARGVLLQPVAPTKNGQKEREALRQLQSQAQLTAAQADDFLREIHAERFAHGNGNQ